VKLSDLCTTAKRSSAVLVAYGAFSVWGMCCLFASLLSSEGSRARDSLSITTACVLAGATVLGHVLGNLLGLLGLRLLPVVVLFLVVVSGVALSSAVLGVMAVYLALVVFAALGGYLGIASRLDVVAAWYPLSFAVGGVVYRMNQHGSFAAFRGGAKHAIWDPFTVICLAGSVFLMLAFLATRHSLALTVWREVGGAPDAARPASPIARPGRGSLAVLFLGALVVLGATAIVSPYLFRSREPSEATAGAGGESKSRASGGSGSNHGGAADRPAGQGPAADRPATQGDEKPKGGTPDTDPREDRARAERMAREALDLALTFFLWVLAAVAAVLALLVLLGPPVRRAVLLRHLARPLWPVTPTARVMYHWRRALALLSVLDVHPEPAETSPDFAARAAALVHGKLGCAAPGLGIAASILERIGYAGRGLGRGEERAMREAVEAFAREVGPRIPLGKRVVAGWGPAPDIED